MILPPYDSFYICGYGGMASELTRPLSARARWYFDRHAERYRRRFGLGLLEYPPRGQIGQFVGVTFTSSK